MVTYSFNSQIVTYYNLVPRSFCVHVCKGTLAIAIDVNQNTHENSGCISQVLAPRQYLLHSSRAAFFVFPCSSNQRYVPTYFFNVSKVPDPPILSSDDDTGSPIIIYSGSGVHRHSHIISDLAISILTALEIIFQFMTYFHCSFPC